MRRIAAASAALLLASACSDATEPPVATSVSIAPTSISFASIGVKRVVRATPVDQRGAPMRGVSIAWSSSSPAVSVASAGGDSAIVTAAANGTATIRASAGNAAGTIEVQVAQAVTSFQKAGGDAQTGVVATTLAEPLRVVARDGMGVPVPGVSVTFAVSGGGGSVSNAAVATGADGTAAATWTLGTTTAGTQQVSATIPGQAPLGFTAQAQAGAPTQAEVVEGDGQTSARNAAVGTRPALRVRDAFGNPVPGVTVTFRVSSGGGSVAGAEVTTDGGGIARVGRWSLGAASGANTLTATVAGTEVPPVVFTATGVASGSLAVVAGDRQAAMAGTAGVAPAVVARDEGGRGIAGLTVTFAVTQGGGSVAGASAVTDANGRATAGAWVLGAVAGPNALTVSVADLAASPVVIRAIGCTGGGGAGYAMTLCFTTPVSASQRAAYQGAAARWSEVIRGDLPALSVSIPAGSCGASPSLDLTIDDLVIFAGVEPIDGPGAVLGQAGWCYRRTGGLPLIGLMRFDQADVENLEASGRFVDVVLHEMGHVLGLSASLWSSLGLLQDPSTGTSVLDTYFTGAGAIAAFDGVGGAGYAGGRKVPVENTGGGGTANSHWRESVLTNELMTGYLNAGSNPLSVVTVGALADMGYLVDASAADAYSLLDALREGPRPRVLHLHDDEYRGPRYEVDRAGRRTRLPR